MPELILALSASLLVAAAFFILSAQVTRATDETRRFTQGVERRTEEAVSSLRQEVETLHETIARRTQERISRTDEAAEAFAENPASTAQDLDQLLKDASNCGLVDDKVRVALKDLIYLSVRRVEPELSTPDQDEGVPSVLLRIAEERNGTSTALAAMIGDDAASVQVAGDEPLSQAFADLREQLLRRQQSWEAFPDDVDRARQNLAYALTVLIRAIEHAHQPPHLGYIDIVLDDEHVLMRSRSRRHESPRLVPLSDPAAGQDLRQLAEAGTDDRPIHGHPFVAREIEIAQAESKGRGRPRDV